MSTTTVRIPASTPYGPAGYEVWCDDCGSVACYFQEEPGLDEAPARRAEEAALLHEDNDHAHIVDDLDGEPHVVPESDDSGTPTIMGA